MFTLTHINYLAISTSVWCFIIEFNTTKKKKRIKKGKQNRDIHVHIQAKPIIYQMLRHCPKHS